jgi:large subunit ribosomal protein L9
MPKLDVILIQNVVGLGAESDHVKVAAGYARNFLFPQKLAIPLTAANKRRLEALRQRRGEREAHELNTMTELAKTLSKVTLLITVKTGEDNKMFGSVTAGTITDELKHQFDVALDKHKIHLEKTIRTVGEHEVELRLHPDVVGRLKVQVQSATPPAPVGEGAPAEKEAAPDRASASKEVRKEGADRKPRAPKGAKSEKALPPRTE